eukprot:scaffold44388_cov161-Skeletonema_marinoi.AAC.1
MVDEFASSSLSATYKEDQADVRDKKPLSLFDACTYAAVNNRRDSVTSKDVNASSITEGSTVDSSDPAVSQRRPAGTSVLDQHNRRPCESSEIAS